MSGQNSIRAKNGRDFEPGGRSGMGFRQMEVTNGMDPLRRGELISSPRGGDMGVQLATIGLDISKQLFQVHGADKAGRPRSRIDAGPVPTMPKMKVRLGSKLGQFDWFLPPPHELKAFKSMGLSIFQ
jgi:hypothetical protein